VNFLSLYKRYFLYKIKKKINIDKNSNFQNHSLEEIFIHYDTDKANLWSSDKKKGHGYAKFYEKHLNSIKDKKIKILEIGSAAGASASSFSKYFSNSKIFCVDINISPFKYSSKQIQVFGLDITNPNQVSSFLKKIKNKNEDTIFDVIIDDGSRKLFDILVAIKFFFNKLNKGGFYIIEDYNLLNKWKHLDDKNELRIDRVIEKIKINKLFESNILSEEFQKNFIKNIKNIYSYKGNLDESDIVFLEKN